VPRICDHWKIGFPLGREQLADWTDSTPEELARRLTEMVPLLDGIKPQVAGVYPVAMVNAARWADGNCVLLGDACHALHPGRSQGMNVALRGVSMLAALLGSSDFPRSPPAVPRLLSDFEAQHKGPIDARWIPPASSARARRCRKSLHRRKIRMAIVCARRATETCCCMAQVLLTRFL
jgi:hypothetical protein